jgi:hypothetical protein
MLQLRLTKKVQTQLGLKPKELSEIKDSDSLLGNWFVNIFVVDRRKTLIFVNEKTLYSFVLIGVKKNNIQYLRKAFINGLKQSLLFESISENEIQRIIGNYNDYEFTKTNNAKILGNTTDLINLYTHKILYDGGLKQCDLTSIIMSTNRTPQRNIGWGYSIDVIKELLTIKKA